MKLKYFGTDGVRGVANRDLSPELAFKVGRAGGYVLTRHSDASSPKSWFPVIREFPVRCWKMPWLLVCFRSASRYCA